MDALKDPMEVYTMALHAQAWTQSGHRVLRVASGWIYYEDDQVPANGVFVPYDNHFQRNPAKEYK